MTFSNAGDAAAAAFVTLSLPFGRKREVTRKQSRAGAYENNTTRKRRRDVYAAPPARQRPLGALISEDVAIFMLNSRASQWRSSGRTNPFPGQAIRAAAVRPSTGQNAFRAAIFRTAADGSQHNEFSNAVSWENRAANRRDVGSLDTRTI